MRNLKGTATIANKNSPENSGCRNSNSATRRSAVISPEIKSEHIWLKFHIATNNLKDGHFEDDSPYANHFSDGSVISCPNNAANEKRG
jgi:hypothetical protein